MKITFLGTGHGWPTAKRHCQCFLIEINKNRYLIDAGAPVSDVLMRKSIPFESIKGLFITHMHGDHFGGIFSFLTPCCYKYKGVSIDVYYPEERAVGVLESMLSFDVGEDLERDRVRMHGMKEGLVFDDGTLKVTAFPTDHLITKNRPSYGYLVETEGKKVYFTGDLHHHDISDYPRWVDSEKIDAIVSECGHFTPEALIDKLKNAKADKIFITHVCPEEKYENLKLLSETVPLILPDDGSEYII